VRDRDDVDVAVEQRPQVARLVLVALARDQVGLRVLSRRPGELPARDGKLEPRQVCALEVVVDVRGRQEETTVSLLHPLIVACLNGRS
jgi:hypothetical protein